jgi:2-amino-4-hydroxy-6-hydroxymethyldihydropteridine diphosphokinase
MMQLQELERQHGRQGGGQRWGARPLDLDILLFGDATIDEPDLTIPHIGLSQRSFVLWPLMELAPELVVPGLGSIRALQQGCQKFGIRRHGNH